MKKLILLSVFASGLILFLGLNSCKHEFAGDLCKLNPVKLTLVSTDAYPNQSNGTITASATGGKDLTYSLNGGPFQSTGNFSGLKPFEIYSVLAKSSFGCADSAKANINVTDPCIGLIISITTTKVDASLNMNNGSITAIATGGTGIVYSINGGAFQTSGTFSGLAAGNYTLTAKSALGCIGTSQVAIATIDPCAGVVVAVSSTKVNPTVGQSNGSIIVTATGGTGFTYSLNSGAYQASGTFSGLAAGGYVLTAKNASGCIGTATASLTAIDPCAGVTVAVTTTQVSPTIGQSNGSITVAATGGTGFTYSLNGGAFQTTATFAGLAAGNYSITAKNSNGCIGSTTASLTAIDPCAGVTITVTTIQVDPTTGQSNGSITATATGGTGFTYSINNGAFQTAGTFTGLATGNYTITAKNSNGCTGSKVVALGSTNPCAGVTVAVTATQVNPTIGLSNGSIAATATGGTGFTYNINNGVYQTSGSFTGLAAGSYTITAKNSNGCLGTATFTLTAVDPCAGVAVAVTTTQINPTLGQLNGSISATATGGTGFTYNINGGFYQTSGTFTGLPAGNYTITAKNSNGCLGTKTVTLTAIDPCAGVTVTVATTQVNPTAGLSNGSITAAATGGTGFTYNINNGVYQATGTFSALAAGTYTITAKNSNGCLGSAVVTLIATSACAGVNITIANAIVNSTPCVTPATGKITVTAGGSTGFMYNINGGVYQTSNIFSALVAGNYTIAAKDVNGCTATVVATVGTVASGPLFAQMRSLISTRCSGGGCHMNGTTTAGYNFDNDCSIVSKWSQINAACVTYTLKPMPISPQATLTAAEKAVITNWIVAGHLYTN
jgi:hypothetical protein